MSVWKFAVIAGCVCAISMPAVAEVKANNSRNAAPSGSASNELDMSQVKLNRKAYVEEIAKSFDDMDTNHDGYVDAKEMSAASENGLRNPSDPLDDSELDTAKELREFQEFQAKGGLPQITKPAPKTAAPAPAATAPATGIPPINSDQLIK